MIDSPPSAYVQMVERGDIYPIIDQMKAKSFKKNIKKFEIYITPLLVLEENILKSHCKDKKRIISRLRRLRSQLIKELHIRKESKNRLSK